MDDEKAFNRALAAEILIAQRAVHNTALTLSVEVAKWVQTSLLAINGAAALATFPIAMPPTYKVVSCGVFVTGVIAALLSGYLQIKLIGSLLNVSGEAIGYWFSVSVDGERLEDIEKGHELAPAKAADTFWPRICGWGSASLFVLGACIAGYGSLLPLIQE